MKSLVLFVFFVECLNAPNLVKNKPMLHADNDELFKFTKKELYVTPPAIANGNTTYNLVLELKEALPEGVVVDSIVYKNIAEVPTTKERTMNCYFVVPAKRTDVDVFKGIEPTTPEYKKVPDYDLKNNQALLFYNSNQSFLIDSILLKRTRDIPM